MNHFQEHLIDLNQRVNLIGNHVYYSTMSIRFLQLVTLILTLSGFYFVTKYGEQQTQLQVQKQEIKQIRLQFNKLSDLYLTMKEAENVSQKSKAAFLATVERQEL